MYQPGVLLIQPDPTRAGVHIVRGTPTDLTTVPWKVSQAIGDPSDLMALHALHQDEQDIPAHQAYENERAELGTLPPPLGPTVEIIELARPHQRNVVWIDRNHLMVTGAKVDVAHRMLGLYVSSKGQIRIMLHHPSVSHQIHEALRNMLANLGDRQLPDEVLQLTRFAVWYDPKLPDAVRVWTPSMYAQMIGSAITG